MTLTKLLLLTVIGLSLAACSSSDAPTHPKSRQENRNDAKKIAVRTAIEKFVQQSNADVTWMTSISQKSAALFQPLYTVDLENVWLVEGPIIFVGKLQDVSTETQADYSLIVTASDFQLPGLRLEILCAKSKVAPVLAQISADKESVQPGGIVVAAKIVKVMSIAEPEKEGKKTVIIGQGRCNNIVYLGDSMDLMLTLNSTSGE